MCSGQARHPSSLLARLLGKYPMVDGLLQLKSRTAVIRCSSLFVYSSLKIHFKLIGGVISAMADQQVNGLREKQTFT